MIRNRITHVKNEVQKMTESKRFNNRKVLVPVAIAAIVSLIVGIGIYNMPANRLRRQLEQANECLDETDNERVMEVLEDLTSVEESSSQLDLETETADISQDNIVGEEATEKDTVTIMYQEYYDKLIELQNKYGLCEDIAEEIDDPFLEENCYLTGLCFAKLIDFDADGTEEMILAYNTGQSSDEDFFQDYIVEVWAYQGSAIQKVYSDKAMGKGEGALGIYLVLCDGKYYLDNYIEEFYDETYTGQYVYELRGYDGNIVDILRRNVWTIVYSEDSQNETFRIDDRDVTKEEWIEERDRWNNLVGDYGFQNGGINLEASVNELATTFKILSEFLEIEWVDNISMEKEEKPYSNSVWGSELIGYWETLSAESFAVWTTLTFYEDGLAELHSRSGVCFGTFEIQSDGSVMLYLNDEYFYDNSVAQWFHSANNIQIQLTMGSNMYEMNFTYIGGTGEAYLPDSVVLTRVTESGVDYFSAEESIRHYKNKVSR